MKPEDLLLGNHDAEIVDDKERHYISIERANLLILHRLSKAPEVVSCKDHEGARCSFWGTKRRWSGVYTHTARLIHVEKVTKKKPTNVIPFPRRDH